MYDAVTRFDRTAQRELCDRCHDQKLRCTRDYAEDVLDGSTVQVSQNAVPPSFEQLSNQLLVLSPHGEKAHKLAHHSRYCQLASSPIPQ
jgi:hypothetical protein